MQSDDENGPVALKCTMPVLGSVFCRTFERQTKADIEAHLRNRISRNFNTTANFNTIQTKFEFCGVLCIVFSNCISLVTVCGVISVGLGIDSFTMCVSTSLQNCVRVEHIFCTNIPAITHCFVVI